MSKTLSGLVAELQSELASLEERALTIRQDINRLCRYDGLEEPYPDAGSGASSASKTLRIRTDHFTGMKLGKAARLYLDLRNEADPDNRAATLEEIRDGLLEGGFTFAVKDAIAALGISLGKSARTFQRIGDGSRFGLVSWYGNGRAPKSKTVGNAQSNTDDEEDDDGSNEVLPETPSAGNTVTATPPAQA